MSTPPRRRRPESRRSKPPGGAGWLPTIAMGLGVIVAGLGIGALVAVFMQRNVAKDSVAAVVTSAPSVQPSAGRAPVVIATILPPRTPRPVPSPSPEPSPSPSPSLEASPAPAAPSSVTPTVHGAPRPTPRALTSDETNAAPAATPSAGQPGENGPTAAASPAETASVPSVVAISPIPSAATPAGSAALGASAYEQHASGVVRGYLDALIRGDQKAAYRALGDGTGAAAGSLTETSFIDPGAHIVSLKVTRIDASNASVGCEIASAKGHYYATYHVTAGSSGPYISEHDYIKV